MQWNGLVLDRHENSVISDTEDGQDEKEQLGRHREDEQDVNEQRGVAVQTIYDLGPGDGGVLDALGN